MMAVLGDNRNMTSKTPEPEKNQERLRQEQEAEQELRQELREELRQEQEAELELLQQLQRGGAGASAPAGASRLSTKSWSRSLSLGQGVAGDCAVRKLSHRKLSHMCLDGAQIVSANSAVVCFGKQTGRMNERNGWLIRGLHCITA
jgi:hypothetical protein